MFSDWLTPEDRATAKRERMGSLVKRDGRDGINRSYCTDKGGVEPLELFLSAAIDDIDSVTSDGNHYIASPPHKEFLPFLPQRYGVYPVNTVLLHQ
jgi:hypothetical protein